MGGAVAPGPLDGSRVLTTEIRAAIAAEFTKCPYAPSFVLDTFNPWYLDIAITARVFFSSEGKAAQTKTEILKNLAAWFASRRLRRTERSSTTRT